MHERVQKPAQRFSGLSNIISHLLERFSSIRNALRSNKHPWINQNHSNVLLLVHHVPPFYQNQWWRMAELNRPSWRKETKPRIDPVAPYEPAGHGSKPAGAVFACCQLWIRGICEGNPMVCRVRHSRWRSIPDSNRHNQLGRLRCCHYINAPCCRSLPAVTACVVSLCGLVPYLHACPCRCRSSLQGCPLTRRAFRIVLHIRCEASRNRTDVSYPCG